MQSLATQLLDASVLNTAKSRARCKELALEIVELIQAQDADQRVVDTPALREARDVVMRLSEALRGAREAGEQAELTRLYVKSERLHRQRKKEQE